MCVATLTALICIGWCIYFFSRELMDRSKSLTILCSSARSTLDPLLERLAHDFVNDADLSARLQSLFRVCRPDLLVPSLFSSMNSVKAGLRLEHHASAPNTIYALRNHSIVYEIQCALSLHDKLQPGLCFHCRAEPFCTIEKRRKIYHHNANESEFILFRKEKINNSQ